MISSAIVILYIIYSIIAVFIYFYQFKKQIAFLCQVLNAAVTGHTTASLSRGCYSLSDFNPENEMDGNTQSGLSTSKLYSGEPTESATVENPKGLCPFETPVKPETDILKLAARTVSFFFLLMHLKKKFQLLIFSLCVRFIYREREKSYRCTKKNHQ